MRVRVRNQEKAFRAAVEKLRELLVNKTAGFSVTISKILDDYIYVDSDDKQVKNELVKAVLEAEKEE